MWRRALDRRVGVGAGDWHSVVDGFVRSHGGVLLSLRLLLVE